MKDVCIPKKTVLEVSLVFLKKAKRIEAMLFLTFVALMIVSLIERKISMNMGKQDAVKLSILTQGMNSKIPTWNNNRYFYRNIHHAQIICDGVCIMENHVSAFISKPQNENTQGIVSRSTRDQEIDGKITQGEMMTKTIVMIHGMFGGGWCWDNYKGFFEKRKFQCHTPTLRNHDVYPKDKPCIDIGTTSLLDYAQDIEDYIGELDARPILIGHSMGGLLGQILAARGLAKGLVLLTPAPPRGIMPLKFSAIKSCLNGLPKWGFWRKPVRLSFRSTVYAMLHLLPKVDQKKTYARLVYESGQAVKETGFWLFDSKKVSKVDESKVTCPVLVVSGAKDRVAPPAMVQKIANKYKQVSTYKEFQNHAHWIMNESGWEEVAEYIDDWMKQTLIK